MKKIICFFIAIVCIATHINAQSKALKQYYYWINQAELAICDSNYPKASDCYHQAFSIRRPFVRHASVAFKINSEYTHNYERATECFHYLIMGGDSIQWYAEDSTMYGELWHIMQKVADTTTSLTIPELHQALDEIRTSDQRVRWRYYNEGESEGDSIYLTDSLNLLKLQELYKTFPVINDYTAGFTPLFSECCIHFAKDLFWDPAKLYYKEVRKGNIDASIYQTMEDRCLFYIQDATGKVLSSRYGTSYTHFFIMDTVGFAIAPNNLKKVAKARKKIYLSETWEDYASKVVYRYQHKTNIYLVATTYIPSNLEKMKSIMEDIDNETIKGSYYIIPKELRR